MEEEQLLARFLVVTPLDFFFWGVELRLKDLILRGPAAKAVKNLKPDAGIVKIKAEEVITQSASLLFSSSFFHMIIF